MPADARGGRITAWRIERPPVDREPESSAVRYAAGTRRAARSGAPHADTAAYTEGQEIAADDGKPPLVIAVNLAVTAVAFANSAAAAIADTEPDGEPVLVALEVDDDDRSHDGDDGDSRHANRFDTDKDDDDEDDNDRNR